MQSHLAAEVRKSFDAMVDAEVSFKGCPSRTRAKISGGQVFIPDVVIEEGRLITPPEILACFVSRRIISREQRARGN
jgi:hypothetical protein